jgi:hypothetical protein
MIRDIDEVYFNGILIGKTGSLVPYLEPDFQKIRIYSIPTKLLIAGENIISIRIYSVGYQQGLKSIPPYLMKQSYFKKCTPPKAFLLVLDIFLFLWEYIS